MKLAIEHETIYRYDAPVRSSTQYLRMTPRATPRQRVVRWQVDTPRPSTQTHDGYGNVLHVLTLDKAVREIRIRAHGVIETLESDEESHGQNGASLSPLVFLRQTQITLADEALAKFASHFGRRGTPLAGLRELAAAIPEKFATAQGQAQGPESLSAAEAFASGCGSVRDHAHVFIACCRHLGIPARYVSGYVLSHTKTPTRIFSHAWTEAWIGERWKGFDLVSTRGAEHLKLAVGADHLDACPIRGIRTGGGLETMEANAQLTVIQ
jgi:transglutaminase-like putative cysteine protease